MQVSQWKTEFVIILYCWKIKHVKILNETFISNVKGFNMGIMDVLLWSRQGTLYMSVVYYVNCDQSQTKKHN